MKKLRLELTGMKCEGCAGAVHAALEGVGGVRRADVSLEDARGELVVDDGVSPEELVSAVEEAGYGARVAGP